MLSLQFKKKCVCTSFELNSSLYRAFDEKEDYEKFTPEHVRHKDRTLITKTLRLTLDHNPS